MVAGCLELFHGDKQLTESGVRRRGFANQGALCGGSLPPERKEAAWS